MKTRNRQLVIQQLDAKMKHFAGTEHITSPGSGWIHSIRTGLNMTLDQLARKIGIRPQSLKAFETREKQGTITLNSLKEVAEALDMKLVYAIIPKNETLEKLIEMKATQKAIEIVNRTANTMALEDQANDDSRLSQALEDKRNELKNEIPKFLWD